MRVISGEFKSRILKSPERKGIRPTTDRAKETLFNTINNLIDMNGIICFDLFCGTGSIGIECISRGADLCYFVDLNTKSVERNTGLLNINDKSVIVNCDSVDFLKDNDLKPGLIFADPPYSYKNYDELLKAVALFETISIIEHSSDFESDEVIKKYLIKEKKAGEVNFSIYDFKN
jgi:16S rRNA (guanine966-N2)-methyltransferase